MGCSCVGLCEQHSPGAGGGPRILDEGTAALLTAEVQQGLGLDPDDPEVKPLPLPSNQEGTVSEDFLNSLVGHSI